MPTPINRYLRLAAPTLLVVSQLAQATPYSISPTRSTVSRFDSVGIERRDGRRYILHRIDQGQTLFAVARRYHVSVDAIRAANPDLSEGVRYDQLLHVPADGATAPTRKEQRDADKVAKKERDAAQRNAAQRDAAQQEAAQPDAVLEKAARKDVKDKARLTTETTRAIATEEQTGTAAKTAVSNTGPGTHLVETGQTLYSLAARYGVSMADLRTWNALGADGIRVGQTLIVSEKAYLAKEGADKTTPRKPDADSRPTISKAKATDVARLDTKPLVTPEPPLAPGSKPKPKKEEATDNQAEARTETRPTEAVERTPPTRRAEPVAEARTTPPKTTEPSSDNEPVAATSKARSAGTVKVQSEIGFADIIDGDNQSAKYLALHRSAPVGTLVQVRNDITNQSLYVKVVGKLPNTGLNDQVLIRLSNRAFEKLSPNGQRFRAEVSYAK